MICDFCSDPDPQVKYPVKAGTPWAACRACAALIEDNDHLGLVRRVLQRLLTPRLRSLEAILLGEVVEELSFHVVELFWSQRAGPAQPLYGPEAIDTELLRGLGP